MLRSVQWFIALAIVGAFCDVAWATDLEPRPAARKVETSLFSPKPLDTNPDWGVMLFGGFDAGGTRLIEIIPKPWTGEYGDNYFVGGALSRRLIQLDKHWKIEGEVSAGYRFNQVNTPEGWVAAFLRFDGFP